MADDELQARLQQGIEKARTAGDFMLAVADLLVAICEHQNNMNGELANADGQVQHERKRHAWRDPDTAPLEAEVLVWAGRPGIAHIGRMTERGWLSDHGLRLFHVRGWQPLPDGPEGDA